MFAKLLKHEWRSTRGLLGVLTLAVLGLGVYGIVALRVLLSMDDMQVMLNPFLSVVRAGLIVTLGLGAIGLAVYSVAVQFILLYRFYKHKFTDEGYLTFTLPVKTEAIYWSSLVNILIWMAISTLVVILVISLVILLGTGSTEFFLNEFMPGLGELLEVMELDLSSWTVAISILNLVANLAYGLVLPLACVTIGAVLAKKHKILTAFVAYYVINWVMSTLRSMTSILPTLLLGTTTGFSEWEQIELYMNVIATVELALTIALAVGGYFLTVHLMKKKLNLP